MKSAKKMKLKTMIPVVKFLGRISSYLLNVASKQPLLPLKIQRSLLFNLTKAPISEFG